MGGWLLVLAIVGAGQLDEGEIEYQDAVFYQWWHADFLWKFEDLPTASRVPAFRVPYSGHIYPDYQGGTSQALAKYDQAFNAGEMLATAYEKRDIGAAGRTTNGGASGTPMVLEGVTPRWHGHCNGWTAAAIRHAEPRHSVQRNGVVFTPQDIKAMLAEIYFYNDPQMLNDGETLIDAGLFHAIIANWLGRGVHPIGMDADPGPEKWNYPIYAYSTSSRKLAANQVEVKMLVAYSDSTPGEYERSPRLELIMRFHYLLELNDDGQIVGGTYYPDSSKIQTLWLPLKPKPAGTLGNQRGNPYVDVREVLSIWHESVPSDQRDWAIIDPVGNEQAGTAPADASADARIDAVEAAEPDPSAG